jgi:hypothetical protein
MTDNERQNFLSYMEEFIKKATGNKELALDFLSRAGICTKEGNLTEPYKHLYIPPIETE